MTGLKKGCIINLPGGANVVIDQYLGQGGQGIVYSVKIDGKPYALKWYTCKFKNKEAFRKIYQTHDRLPPINKALFDAIATQFALLVNDERQKLKMEKLKFKNLLRNRLNEDSAFFSSITSSTGDKNKIVKRHETIKELIQQTLRI